MSKVLITGATGFVGRRLCQMMAQRGINFTPAYRQELQHMPHGVVVGNIDGGTDWSGALQGVDVVIHLAARVHVMKDQSVDPLAEFREINVDATVNLARQAISHGVKRFVFISSVKVNGEETGRKPFSACDLPAPSDSYGVSKMEAEQALRDLAESSGLEVVIVRPPLVYGPGVRANFFRLMRLAKTGLPVPFGAVTNRRSLVALDNLVDFLITCSHHPRAAGRTFMVSDDHDVGIGELHGMLAALMGKRARSIAVPVGVFAKMATLFGKTAAANRLVGSLQVDIALSKTVLDWAPHTTMEAALKDTVEHFMTKT